MMNPAQDGLAPPGGAPSYQQPLYLQEPHTPVTTHRYVNSFFPHIYFFNETPPKYFCKDIDGV